MTTQASGADYLDRFLKADGGVIEVQNNGESLPAPVDKLDLVGTNVTVTYEQPGQGEDFGTAHVAIEGSAGTPGSPVDITVGAVGAEGTGSAIALANHVHRSVRGTPYAVGATNVAGTSGEFVGADHVHALPFSVLQAVLGGATGPIGFNGQVLSGIGTPTSGTHAASKAYVDAVSSGVKPHDAVSAVATGNVASLNGLGVTVDGVALNAGGMRVLLTAQTSGVANGAYAVASGSWVRVADLAAASGASGAFFFVTGGTTYGSSGWVCRSATGSDVVGTDSLAFSQFSAAGIVSAGAGLTKTGNTLDVVADADGSIVVAADSLKVGVLASDAQHGKRGGGDSHPLASSTAAGFVPLFSSMGTRMLMSDGSAPVWVTIASQGITTGSGTTNRLAKYSTNGTLLASSNVSDSGTKVTVLSPLDVSGTLQITANGDVGLGISNIASTHSNWGWVASTSTGTDGSLTLWESATPVVYITNTGFMGVGVTNPTANVDVVTLRVRGGTPEAGKVLQSDSNGNATWDWVANAGFSPWSAYVTINSGDTSATVGSLTFPPAASRVSSTWVGLYEIELYARTSSSTTALCIYKITRSIAVTYDGSGNATVAYVTGQTDGAPTQSWLNHSGGVPTISGVELGAVSGNSVPVQLSKPGSGSVFSARSRYRAISLMKTTDWY